VGGRPGRCHVGRYRKFTAGYSLLEIHYWVPVRFVVKLVRLDVKLYAIPKEYSNIIFERTWQKCDPHLRSFIGGRLQSDRKVVTGIKNGYTRVPITNPHDKKLSAR